MTTNVLCGGSVMTSTDDIVTTMVGRRYRITDGAMRGLEGVVCQRTRQGKILLGVSILGQDTLLEIGSDRLELVGPEMEDCLAATNQAGTETADV